MMCRAQLHQVCILQARLTYQQIGQRIRCNYYSGYPHALTRGPSLPAFKDALVSSFPIKSQVTPVSVNDFFDKLTSDVLLT